MKLSKIASVVSLLGLLVFSSPNSNAGGGPSGFFTTPFGKLQIKIQVHEQNFGSPAKTTWIDNGALMRLVIECINSNEKANYTLPSGAHFWFTGSQVLIRDGDGNTFLNLSSSPFGGNYMSIGFGSGMCVERNGTKGRILETDAGFFEFSFDCSPSLFSK